MSIKNFQFGGFAVVLNNETLVHNTETGQALVFSTEETAKVAAGENAEHSVVPATINWQADVAEVPPAV